MARPAVKKREIDKAAVYLFATQGLARTTVKDIAVRAGVAEGALYRHYSGKNDMAWELFCREVERFSVRLREVLFDEERSLAERVREGVRFIYQYYEEHPLRFSFILLTQHGFPEEDLLDVELNPNDMLIRFVRNEAGAGRIRACDVVLMASLLMGAVLRPLVMHRYDRLKKRPGELANDVAAACLAMLCLTDTDEREGDCVNGR